MENTGFGLHLCHTCPCLKYLTWMQCKISLLDGVANVSFLELIIISHDGYKFWVMTRFGAQLG